ncbi:hypothetical protein KIN20_010433 [Parelaphostrongylus tenuis]|uniref:Uncharacterized protein n=1 Tax=Parelaphostrongylus tenuis TaxID=148309 RepID=A0AAD5MU32_PARTN|nr:hypothetical protein KIN20_010433 [Parelaphostrongylus tenuis]
MFPRHEYETLVDNKKNERKRQKVDFPPSTGDCSLKASRATKKQDISEHIRNSIR